MADVFTKKKRSEVMSRIRSKNTKIELSVFKLLRSKKILFRKHHKIPGNPDVVVTALKKAIFIDGDFWHGWQFAQRREKLPIYWQNKIENNIKRDRRNRLKLKRDGWQILRIWEHDLEKNPEKTGIKIVSFLAK
jgi:DNA mismatch endonuclease (patch repair protein)